MFLLETRPRHGGVTEPGLIKHLWRISSDPVRPAVATEQEHDLGRYRGKLANLTLSWFDEPDDPETFIHATRPPKGSNGSAVDGQDHVFIDPNILFLHQHLECA
jgi:hypothetical protein